MLGISEILQRRINKFLNSLTLPGYFTLLLITIFANTDLSPTKTRLPEQNNLISITDMLSQGVSSGMAKKLESPTYLFAIKPDILSSKHIFLYTFGGSRSSLCRTLWRSMWDNNIPVFQASILVLDIYGNCVLE